MSATGDLEALQQINHIVLLMMDDRCFDHMLGSLTQDGMPEVDGLKGDESNPDVEFFDHTALIETILLRFAAVPAAVTQMDARVAGSPHLAGDGAGQPLVLSSFAQEFGSFALAMRASGLAPGHP